MSEETVLLKDLFKKKLKEQWYTKPRNKSRKKYKHDYSTGFLNVSTLFCKNCKENSMYQYKWFDEKQKRTRYMSSVRLKDLKKKVEEMGFEWEIINHNEALKTAKKEGIPLLDLK